jgi:predicted transposase YbfD/YdcC
MDTREKQTPPFFEHFAGLPDPRTRRADYPLQELLLVAVCAILCGADNWVDVAEFGEAKLKWLRRVLPFENGIAAHDTFGRVFALLDAAAFEACFIGWMSSLCPALSGVVPVDGKTVRRSHGAGRKAIHVVSAFAHGLGLALGQVKTAEKSNEITAIPELLDALLLKGCLVTIDAMGCQKAIAGKIIAKEADYALMVKNNQPTLAAALEGFFETAEREGFGEVAHTRAEWVEKGHGRIETRRCVAADAPAGLEALAGWPGLKTLVLVESIREINGQASLERRYYISSRQADAERLGLAVRGHWGIENRLHWLLDVAYGEDQSRMREGNSAENFSILRRITLNLVRLDKSRKTGVKNCRLKAGWDNAYMEKLLGMQVPA